MIRVWWCRLFHRPQWYVETRRRDANTLELTECCLICGRRWNQRELQVRSDDAGM